MRRRWLFYGLEPCSGAIVYMYSSCPCIVINPAASGNASNAVRKLDEWEVTQAWVQLSLSALSLLLGGSFLACYAIWPEIMCVYPLTLAFWIYFSDLLLTAQLLTMAAMRLAYSRDPAHLDELWPMTSDPDCLCDFSPDHPGCKCTGGAMAFLLQVGLVGSVAFYGTLVDSLYRSVTDPFTRPASRLSKSSTPRRGSYILSIMDRFMSFESIGAKIRTTLS